MVGNLQLAPCQHPCSCINSVTQVHKLFVDELDTTLLIGVPFYLEIYYNLVDVINIMFSNHRRDTITNLSENQFCFSCKKITIVPFEYQ
jgi:hypothetical protein